MVGSIFTSGAGKHSMKKDDYLTTMMQVPPKQKIPITPFDQRMQREAFSVSLEGLKGVRLPPVPLRCRADPLCSGISMRSWPSLHKRVRTGRNVRSSRSSRRRRPKRRSPRAHPPQSDSLQHPRYQPQPPASVERPQNPQARPVRLLQYLRQT